MIILRNLDLDKDGVARAQYPVVTSAAFQALQQATYAQLQAGDNAKNKLKRGIAWGVFVRDQFIWTDRTTYSLSRKLNPEEEGRVRRFPRIAQEFLVTPEIEAVFCDVFRRLNFPESCRERAYEIQLSAIRYEPTLAEPALPSPIAPHQDLIDGAVLVLNRTGPIVGGTSRIYDKRGTPLYEFDLQVGEMMLIRDKRVLHQVTPLLLAPDHLWRPGDRGYRDILIIRFQPVGR